MANLEELAEAAEGQPTYMIVVRAQGVAFRFDRDTHYYTTDGTRLTVKKKGKDNVAVAQFGGSYALTIEEEEVLEDAPAE